MLALRGMVTSDGILLWKRPRLFLLQWEIMLQLTSDIWHGIVRGGGAYVTHICHLSGCINALLESKDLENKVSWSFMQLA